MHVSRHSSSSSAAVASQQHVNHKALHPRPCEAAASACRRTRKLPRIRLPSATLAAADSAPAALSRRM